MEFEFGNLHYKHSSTAKKITILFLHSFNSSAASFDFVCELLKDRFNIIALDLPGHGLSSHIDVNKYSWYYSLEGFTSILTQFVNRLQLNHFFIVGDSVGGNMAVRAMPGLKNLQGLILIGSVQANSKQKLFEVFYNSEAAKLASNKDLNEKEIDIVAAANVSLSNKEAFEQMVYDIGHTDGNCRKFFSQYMDTQPWVDEPNLLKNAVIPFMYILGKQDGFIDYKAYKMRLLEEKIINESQIKILDNVRHVPPLDDPHLCASLILEFVKSSTKS